MVTKCDLIDPTILTKNFLTEWKGKRFPFSKSCSFYRLEVIDGKKQIV